MLKSLFQTDRFDFRRPKTQTPSSFSTLPSFPPRQKSPVSDRLRAMQADGELLLAALRRYLSVAKPAEQQEPPSHLRPLYNNRMETSGPKKESSKSRPVMTAKTQVGSIKDPLTSVDGMLVQRLRLPVIVLVLLFVTRLGNLSFSFQT